MENLLNKAPVKRIRDYIKNFNSSLDILVLKKSAKTAKDASVLLNCEIGAIVKSLLLKINGNFLICLIAGDRKCSFVKLKEIFNKEDIHMASPNEVKINTGFSIGGVAPFAHKKKLDVLIDKSLKRFKYMYAAAGHPNCVLKVNYEELIKITKGNIKEISE
jgi:Cys-tRNA(Pro) deacylase